MASFRDLVCWQRGLDLVDQLYDLTAAFPSQERFALASQVQRAGVSVPANIAEGHGRASTKEYLRHLSISRGSLAELETLLEIAARRRFISRAELQTATQGCQEVDRMLNAIQKTLRRRLRDQDP